MQSIDRRKWIFECICLGFIFKKAIQIAVSHFLYHAGARRDPCSLTSFIYSFMSLLRSITIFILNSNKALVAQMRISNARMDGYMHLIKHEYLASKEHCVGIIELQCFKDRNRIISSIFNIYNLVDRRMGCAINRVVTKYFIVRTGYVLNLCRQRIQLNLLS